MSITASCLFGQAPSLHGKITTYLSADYIDAHKKKSGIDLESSWKPVHKKANKGHQHMVDKKMANIATIKTCLASGVNTQKEINRRTRMPKGTLCTRMAGLVESGEVIVNKDVYPWQYILATKS